MDPVTIGVTFAAAAFSPFLQVLLDRAISYAQKKIGAAHLPKDELKRLQGTLLKIRAMLSDVETRRVDSRSLTIWLSELKDAAYDIDDVLDELAVEVRRQQLATGREVNDVSRLLSRRFATKIKEYRQRLDGIAKERQDLQLGELELVPTGPGGIRGRQNTSSFVDQTRVFGREEDKENVIRMLLRSGDGSGPDNRGVVILPIVGMGGVGKTTLAQLVYNDEQVERHFHLRMWVCVSHNFDLVRLTREILESASAGATCDLTNLNMLQWLLGRKLAAKRLLLVLDDVWDVDHSEWDSLVAPLLWAARGSRVLLTTRNRGVGRLAGTMAPFFLEVLSTDACWHLFKLCAFRCSNPDGYPKLEAIGWQIVQKLKGSPLAAKTLGRLLNSALEEERVWKNILDSEIWELQQGDNDILPVLRLSYLHLPANLKQCFAFCSIFPKNFKFQKASLVQIWMAEGFIQPQGRRRLEDTGSDYFDDLSCKSLFQGSDKDGYRMHDLIHDLAQSISADECFTAEDGMPRKMPTKVRHLSLTSTSHNLQLLFQDASKFRSLRTLLALHKYTTDISSDLNKLLGTAGCVRVLDLSHSRIRELPDSICNLKHLRYMDVSNTSLISLPESLGKLFHLQTIKLLGCPMYALPKCISNLTNLRHIEADSRLISLIAQIGNLTFLQELKEYKILKENGYRIGELKHLTELRGSLSIRRLENVGHGEDVAILSNKAHLDEVELEWEHRNVDTSSARLDLEILQGLVPHPNIKKLLIRCYGGHRSPSWMESKILSNLECMHLWNCRNWEFLPSLGQLRFLKSLKIEMMYAVQDVTGEFCGSGDVKGFPSLKELHFSDMPKWEKWSGLAEEESFPSLSKLFIMYCPQLKELPLLPPALAELHIENVGLEALPGMAGQGGSLMALENLTIRGCEELRLLPQRWFGGLTSLKSLTIVDCPMLMARAGGLPSSLENLQVASSHALVEGLVMAPLNLASCVCNIDNGCQDLECCVLKVLQHLTTAQQFTISYFDDPSALPSSTDGVFLQYEPSCEGINLEVRCFGDLPNSSNSSLLACLQMLSSISSLSINGLSTLEILPGDVLCRLTSLQEMEIRSCKELTLLGIQALTSLQRLTITDCPKLTVLSPEGPSQPPIQFLEINNSVLFTSRLHNLTSLQHLIIRSCDGLEVFTNQEEEWLRSLCSLQKLWILDCPRLRSIPVELQSLRFLNYVKIQNCPFIRSLPGHRLPDSLTDLVIRLCPLLKDQCRSQGGTHWLQFSHIPYISVDDCVIQDTR